MWKVCAEMHAVFTKNVTRWIVTKTEMARYLLPKLPNIKFHEDLCRGSQAVMFVEMAKF